jgi:hypothetical protein
LAGEQLGNILVLFTSDNGCFRGEHGGLGDKRWAYIPPHPAPDALPEADQSRSDPRRTGESPLRSPPVPFIMLLLLGSFTLPRPLFATKPRQKQGL